MAVHFHIAGGWGACGLPLSGYLHTQDPSKVTCNRPGCRKVIPKSEQPRRIALVITPATATHCMPSDGSRGCKKLNDENQTTWCDEYDCGQKIDPDGIPLRLPECIAAEVK